MKTTSCAIRALYGHTCATGVRHGSSAEGAFRPCHPLAVCFGVPLYEKSGIHEILDGAVMMRLLNVGLSIYRELGVL